MAKLTKEEKEHLFDQTVGNQAKALKTKRTCAVCRIASGGRDKMEIGETVVTVGRRVAHARHFILSVVGVR